MSQYQPLPESGEVQEGFYTTQYGRVWVRKAKPEWIYDTRNSGHYEDRFETQLEGCGWVYPSKVTPEIIEKGFKERNQERGW